jgi:hypothetical protein
MTEEVEAVVQRVAIAIWLADVASAPGQPLRPMHEIIREYKALGPHKDRLDRMARAAIRAVRNVTIEDEDKK